MNTVKLLNLVLTNYRNLDHMEFNFNGEWSKIVGENRIGKTNTLEAIYWLLTDKLLTGSSDIQAIKSLADTTKEVRVEATFSIWDPKIPQLAPRKVQLKKEYGEIWTRTRGTDSIEFKGHYTTYYHNGVKQPTIKAYQTLVNEDFGIKADYGKIDVMRLLIDPTYLGELGEDKDWTELRHFIINIIGDVCDDDVFNKESSLSIIRDDLLGVNGRIDQLKKQYKGSIDSINETIIGNDAQIELLESIEKPTDAELDMAKRMVQDADDKIARLQNDKGSDSTINFLNHQINEKQKEINETTAVLLKKNPVATELKESEERSKYLTDKISQLKTAIWDKKSEVADLNHAAEYLEKKNQELETQKADKLNHYYELTDKIKKPEEHVDLVCPTCNRPLDNKDEVIAKMVEEWTAQRDAILKDGKECANTIESNKTEIGIKKTKIENLNKDILNLQDELKVNEDELEENSKKRANLYESAHNYTPSSEDLDLLNKQLADLKKDLENAEKDENTRHIATNEAIAQEQEKVQPYREVIKKHDYWKLQQETLTEVKAKRKGNAKLLALTEQKKELLNRFIYIKLHMLDERVESVFGHIKFQLVKPNINGGFDAVCKPYIYDVDKDESTNVLWKSGSKSERIVTGIAIAEKIKAALGLPDLPFLFDEGGEISSDTFNTKFKTNAQLICVKVQDNIKKPMVLKI